MRLSVRLIVREWRECPATIVICLCWIAIFAGMAYAQLLEARPTSWNQWVYLGITDGRRFGDCSMTDLAHGQLWRLVTSTFVHYNLLHIGLNLLIMYQLGSVVESWYGSAQFLFLYLLMGGGGNAVSAVIRTSLKTDPRVHWGGGSVVIMGLVALCCVVGWRTNTLIGRKLGRQMVFVLAATAGLGVLLPRYIDNWGHAGGALVGAMLGFADRWLLKRVSLPSAWGSGVISAIILLICGAAQFEVDRREAPARSQQALARHVIELDRAAHRLTAARQTLARTESSSAIHNLLAGIGPELSATARNELNEVQLRAQSAEGQPLDPATAKELGGRLDHLVREIRTELVAIQRRLRELRSSHSRQQLEPH
jgi:membrane associated rhomboid family serine protease